MSQVKLEMYTCSLESHYLNIYTFPRHVSNEYFVTTKLHNARLEIVHSTKNISLLVHSIRTYHLLLKKNLCLHYDKLLLS